jgi:prefoldin subunit 5
MTAETVNYFLESVLKEIKDSIQSVDQKLDNLEKGFDQKLKTLHKLVVG